jgi:hypothetical protein
MKFFIPAADNPEMEASVYSSIRQHLTTELGADFNDRKIHSLDWHHNGEPQYAEVGKPTRINGELVVAILYEPGRRLYHVCTPNRGVVRGGSILAGETWQTSARDFEG